MRLSPPSRQQLVLVAFLSVATLPLVAQSSVEPVDLEAIQRIKEEGFDRSAVVTTISNLTDLYGPRLTNSPQMHRAAAFVRDRMKEWDIDVRFETWGTFGRGWENEHTSIHVTAPNRWPMIGLPKAWTPGTNGAVRGEVIAAPIADEAMFDRFKGMLKGKWVLLSPARPVPSLFTAPARRYTAEDLEALSTQIVPSPDAPGPSLPGPDAPAAPSAADFRRQRMAFLVAEGAAGIIEVSPANRGDNLTVRVQAPASGEGSYAADDPAPLPQLVVAPEHYHRLLRMLGLGQTVTVDVDVRNRFVDDELDVYNLVAELPGTDKADEVVLLGAHFDSWHGGTGATDNGASSAVIMEAMRILKASGLPLRRTVRMVLWTGEEQGLLGSRAYVARHFGGTGDTPATAEHPRVAAYFNQDNGAGAYRGIYLQGNDAVAPIFKAWMEPFTNTGMTTLSIRSTGSTDHVPFDAAGLPGFQFIQDPMDYGTWTHHTTQDLFERVNPQDAVMNAVIMASFVYHAANRDEPLPRKAR